MLNKLMLVTIASLVLVSGVATAAPPAKQQFHLDVTGAIEAAVNSGDIRSTIKQKNVGFQKGDGSPLSVQFSLGTFWQTAIYDVTNLSGVDCFPLLGGSVVPVQGAIHVSETKNDTAKAVFWFSSKYENAGSGIRYMLTLTAPVWTDDQLELTTFPPTEIAVSLPSDTTATFMLANTWKMETEGKGKSRNSSCKGSGDFSSNPGAAPLLIVNQIPLE